LQEGVESISIQEDKKLGSKRRQSEAGDQPNVAPPKTPARRQPARDAKRPLQPPVLRPSVLEFEDLKKHPAYPDADWHGGSAMRGSVVAGWMGWKKFKALQNDPNHPRLCREEIPAASVPKRNDDEEGSAGSGKKKTGGSAVGSSRKSSSHSTKG
jgi:hypothetical protein